MNRAYEFSLERRKNRRTCDEKKHINTKVDFRLCNEYLDGELLNEKQKIKHSLS